jgi:UDPglucose--hexose-1-phosphate uridylyltransferase
MELERKRLTAEMVEPGGRRPTRTEIDLRIDPLTGHSSRILPARGLIQASEFDLEAFASESRSQCPFCPERIEELTPTLPAAVAATGRIGRGEAILFPNLHAYGSHSCVSVYSPELHFLPLARMTERLIADNLAVQVAHAKAVIAVDPSCRWASVNANHMLPSGSSLFHPHLQGIIDPHPTTMQRLLAEVPAARYDDYLRTERAAGERYLGHTGRVEWLVSFAPIAPAELRAFAPAVASPAELDDDLVAELAHGLALALGAYAELGFESFNMALYGAPPGSAGYPLNLRLAVRSNLRPLYRSDSTFLERLHWEGAIDLVPEELALAIGERFRA